MSNRLNITFSNKEVIEKIASEATSQQVSKSELIESVMREYLDRKDIELNEKIAKYLSSFINLNYLTKEQLNLNDDKYHLVSGYLLHKTLEIKYYANSISVPELNKLYLNNLGTLLNLEKENDRHIYKCDGIFYVVLIREVRLLNIIKLSYNWNDIDVIQRKKFKNKKYFYEFEVDYTLIKVGKIIVECNPERKSPMYSLAMFSEHNPFISKELFERIDFSSIEYRTLKESEILNMKKSKRTYNYYPIIPIIASRNGGGYYIKLSNKVKSINQYLKKSTVHFLKEHSFVNILPIRGYVKDKAFHECTLELEKKGK